jgi:hypothetical protein
LTAVKAPLAFVPFVEPERLRPVLFAPEKMGSLTPAWNCPAAEILPASTADFVGFENVPLSVSETGSGVSDTDETVPAAFGVPTPGL